MENPASERMEIGYVYFISLNQIDKFERYQEIGLDNFTKIHIDRLTEIEQFSFCFCSHEWKEADHPDRSGYDYDFLKRMKNVSVTHYWYDFSCAPQHPRQEKDQQYFDWILGQIQTIQRSCLNVIVPRMEYFNRFWCVFEFLNAVKCGQIYLGTVQSSSQSLVFLRTMVSDVNLVLKGRNEELLTRLQVHYDSDKVAVREQFLALRFDCNDWGLIRFLGRAIAGVGQFHGCTFGNSKFDHVEAYIPGLANCCGIEEKWNPFSIGWNSAMGYLKFCGSTDDWESSREIFFHQLLTTGLFPSNHPIFEEKSMVSIGNMVLRNFQGNVRGLYGCLLGRVAAFLKISHDQSEERIRLQILGFAQKSYDVAEEIMLLSWEEIQRQYPQINSHNFENFFKVL